MCVSSPFVSIVMSVYNGEESVGEAIDSCLNQTYCNFELIVINDGSTDNTGDVLSSYEIIDPRVFVFNRTENVGLAASLNEGIRRARGVWIARMDSDDVSLPQRLARQMEFINENPRVDIVGTAAVLRSSKGDRLGVRVLPCSHEELCRRIHLSSPFIHPSVVIRKSSILDVGGYDESLSRAQDYDLWSRMIGKYTFHNIQEPLIIYTYPDRLKFRSIVLAAIVRVNVGVRTRRVLPSLAKALLSVFLGGLKSIGIYRSRTSRRANKS